MYVHMPLAQAPGSIGPIIRLEEDRPSPPFFRRKDTMREFLDPIAVGLITKSLKKFSVSKKEV